MALCSENNADTLWGGRQSGTLFRTDCTYYSNLAGDSFRCLRMDSTEFYEDTSGVGWSCRAHSPCKVKVEEESFELINKQ